MKRKRLSPFRRRARESENLDGGQDSFLDVVSNLVGVLIILIMVAGVRVRTASSEQTPFNSSSNSTNEAQKSGLSEEELAAEGIDCLPGSLEEAIKEAEKDPFIKATLGDHVYNNYIEGKKREWDEYKTQISQWEIDRYMINH